MDIFFNGLTVEFFKNLFELLFENLRPYKVHGMLNWEYKTLIIRNTIFSFKIQYLKIETENQHECIFLVHVIMITSINYDYKYKTYLY